MKKLIIVGIFSTMFTTSSAYAEYYKLTYIKRTDSNTYSYRSGSVNGIIITKYCYEYAYGDGDEAILKYEPHDYDNKIIFNDGTTCEVSKVFTTK